MIKFTILESSITPGANGEQNFAFRREDFPGVIWGVEDMVWNEEEEAVIANVSVFREQMEEGQIVANQVTSEDPQYGDLMVGGEEVINSMIDYAVEEAAKSLRDQESK